MKKILTLTAILFVLGAQAQPTSCTVYERELQEIFTAYKPGSQINLRRVEDIYAACPRPGEKMSLIYYYFKSVSAFLSDKRSERSAFEDAAYYYDLCARHFPYLVQAGPEDRAFTDLFFARAEQVELSLGNESRRLNYYLDSYRYGASSEEVWAKKNPPVNSESAQGKSRGIEPAEEITFTRSADNPAVPAKTSTANMRLRDDSPAGEDFGYVGKLEALTFMDYLRFRGETQEAQEALAQQTGEYTMRSSLVPPAPSGAILIAESPGPDEIVNDWMAELSSNDLEYIPMVSFRDDLLLRNKPGSSGGSNGKIAFFEKVARFADVATANADGRKYVKVRTHSGKIGWVDESGLVEEGQVAVFVSSARGVLNLSESARYDRNAIVFLPGEAVVLEAADGNWVRVVTRNGEKRAWVQGVSQLSIEPMEVEIGVKYGEALREASASLRMARLEDIRRMSGFEQSELAPVINQRIRAEKVR